MPDHAMSRRALLGSAGVMAGFAAANADAAPPDKPGSLTITRVETFALAHKLPRAVGVSTALADTRTSLLVKISTDSGLVGWGETADFGDTRSLIETRLKPLLLGKNPLHHRQLWRAIWGPNFGNGRAVAGVDVALHDLRGKALGVPVADLFGGRLRDQVLVYASALNYTDGVRPEDQFPEEAAGLVKRGFRAIKMRTGRFEPRRDLAVLAKVREAAGPDTILLTDGNGAFTIPEAVKFGKELEKLDFYCFEEPLPQGLNYAGYSVLAEKLDIALAGGEGLDSRVAARDHIVRRSFDIIQPDVILCGGIGEVLFIAEMARLWSIPCLPHCWSGAVGVAATLQLLSLLPNTTFGVSSDQPMLELDTIENPMRDQLLTKPFTFKAGHMTVPTGPGLGIEVDEDAVKKLLAK